MLKSRLQTVLYATLNCVICHTKLCHITQFNYCVVRLEYNLLVYIAKYTWHKRCFITWIVVYGIFKSRHIYIIYC